MSSGTEKRELWIRPSSYESSSSSIPLPLLHMQRMSASIHRSALLNSRLPLSSRAGPWLPGRKGSGQRLWEWQLFANRCIESYRLGKARMDQSLPLPDSLLHVWVVRRYDDRCHENRQFRIIPLGFDRTE